MIHGNLIAALRLHEFFEAVVITGLALLVCIIVPVQLVAKWRRFQRKKTRIICRICGYRFLRQDPTATCPHCQSKNR
ncbi:MAG: hypothetical protein E7031_10110 [Akkermansiaceae bacterium]|nr:hypothetical protein [Akkermansiaceae bacterium]